MKEKLLGNDLRSIAKADEVVSSVTSQKQFDELFAFLYEGNRLLTMRSIDAIEKITRKHPQFLKSHKKEIFAFSQTAENIEFKWHLALLLSRVELNKKELTATVKRLTSWALNKAESKIVRVNAIQALFEISTKNPIYKKDFCKTAAKVKSEHVPSLDARIKKLANKQEENKGET